MSIVFVLLSPVKPSMSSTDNNWDAFQIFSVQVNTKADRRVVFCPFLFSGEFSERVNSGWLLLFSRLFD